MKQCKRCEQLRPDSDFGLSSRSQDGLCLYCKTCERDRARRQRAANPEHAAAIARRSRDKTRSDRNARRRASRAADPNRKALRKAAYAKYRERELAVMREYKAANNARMRVQARERYHADIDAARARQNAYLDANRGKARAWRMKRIAQQLSATPQWADARAIEVIYAVAARVSNCTGIPHEVDHVIPLQGAVGRRRVVSGLHVEYNLRVVSRSANRMKSNQL